MSGPAPALTDPLLDAAYETDLGNARRFVNDWTRLVRYVEEFKAWYVWTETHWTRSRARARELAKKTVLAILREASYAETNEERTKLSKHAIKSQAAPRIAGMMDLAESDPRILVASADLDPYPWLLNTLNGVVDLQSGALLPHDSSRLITRIVPTVFDAAAECPRWLAFLDRILDGKTPLIAFVQRAIGYALAGVTSEQTIFIFWGAGANGKSTLLAVLLELLGDYAQMTPSSTLMAKERSDIPNDVARLKGVRFVAAVEAEEHRRLGEAFIKQVTGDRRLAARFMRGEWFDFTPEFTIFFATNHKPVIRGTDHAMWRRVRLVPFTVTIPDDQQDKFLVEKLREEFPGILRWAVEGCLAWQRDGLGEPDDVRAATAAYRAEMDTFGDFLSDRTEPDPSLSVSAGALYDAYLSWCGKQERPLSKKAFGLQLAARGFVAGKDASRTVRVWRGLRLKRQAAQQDLPQDALEHRTCADMTSGIAAHEALQGRLFGNTRPDASGDASASEREPGEDPPEDFAS